MAPVRRAVTCGRCGYVTVPVSGFCPRCLSVLPRSDETPLWPFAIAGVLTLVLIGVVAARDQVGVPAAAPSFSAPPAATASPNAAQVTAPPTATPPSTTPAPTPPTAAPTTAAPTTATAAPTAAPTAVAGFGSLPSTATDVGSGGAESE